MESMILLAGLFFIGGPILLFFLVIGARSRVRVLEEQVRELQWKVRNLSAQPAESPRAEEAPVAESRAENRRDQPDQVVEAHDVAQVEPRAIPLKDLPRGVTLTVSREPAPEKSTPTEADYSENVLPHETTAAAPEDRLPDAYRPDESGDPASTEDARRFALP